MSEQELILLGLLRESPKHGYEIKKKIKEILSFFAGVQLKSIYYPLQTLEKKGLVTKHINKQGRRPQRFIYRLTPKGENRFKGLLSQSLLKSERPQFSLDLSLYFLHYLAPEIVKRRLRGRMLILKKISSGLRIALLSAKKRKSLAITRILEHNLTLLKSEFNFLNNLISTL